MQSLISLIMTLILMQALGSSIVRAGEPGSISPVTAQYLANEGVLIRTEKRHVIFDFPFSGKFDWCISPEDTQIQALLLRHSPFESVDAFIFTHDHVDHFDPALVVKALEAHSEATLVGTSLVLKRVREAGGGHLKNPMFEAQPGNDITWNDIRIQVMKAPHARYWDIDPATGKRVIYDDGYVHVAYLLTLEGVSVVHGGDAHDITFPQKCSAALLMLDRGYIDKKGQPALMDLHRRLQAQRTVLMHIGPSEMASMRALAQKESAWLSAFTEKDQIITLTRAKHSCLDPASIGLRPELFQPGLISGAAHDLSVRFTPEMDQLYLMRSGLDYHTAILRFRCVNGAWAELELAPISFSGSISYPFISPDGTQIFFDGSIAEGPPDIWTASREGASWGKATPLGIEVNSATVEMHCSALCDNVLETAPLPSLV